MCHNCTKRFKLTRYILKRLFNLHLEDAAHSEAAGAGAVRGAADLVALVGGEAGPVVAGGARALCVLELDPRDQVQELGGDNINKWIEKYWPKGK